MNKVIPRIAGGIGNQLFMYAAARRLALVSKSELVIDNVSGFVRDQEYQQRYQLHHFSIPCRKATATERLEPFSRVRHYLKRIYNRDRPIQERNFIQQKGVDFEPNLLQCKPHGTLYLEGYWQSENYFLDVAQTIRADLQIKPPIDATNLEISAHIRNSLAVAVHVRFFDMPNENGINNAPSDYYARAVSHMESLLPNAHYFVFSDNPETARISIPLPNERISYVSHNRGDKNAYADLWLMTQCQHYIIANSTFSWWGAWLSANVMKKVIAPDCEMRHGKMQWGFDGLLPNEWIKL